MADTSIGIVTVHAVVDRLSAAAEHIDDTIADHLTKLAFRDASVGRVLLAHGEALRAGLD
ncbi:hypothetical protein [Mycobacterium uberis]|uniref:hypothetical protein n=1 Tax=Mycobacterium uberis TaxID=2162698 RepID=UPI001FB2C167|nr:hypothetical protein [Mycobacterium uberis]